LHVRLAAALAGPPGRDFPDPQRPAVAASRPGGWPCSGAAPRPRGQDLWFSSQSGG